eukprot:6291694-Alexandrium_andersonii.AAC.1
MAPSPIVFPITLPSPIHYHHHACNGPRDMGGLSVECTCVGFVKREVDLFDLFGSAVAVPTVVVGWG